MRLFRNLVTSQLWWHMPLIPAPRRPAELSHQDPASNNNKGRQWEIKLPKGSFCTPRFYLDLELDKWDAIIVKDWEGHSVRTICPDSPCPVFVTVFISAGDRAPIEGRLYDQVMGKVGQRISL